MAAFSNGVSGEADARETVAVRPRFSRRWLQFGFGTLLKLVAVAAVLSAWWADHERLTDRLGKLENDQSVLRSAMGDDLDDAPAAYRWPGSPPVATIATMVSPYGAPSPAYGVPAPAVYASTAYPVASALDGDLFDFLHENKNWLKAHFAEDRGWQQFLAKGRPPTPPPSYPQPPSANAPGSLPGTPSADPLVIPAGRTPAPPDAGPQSPEPAPVSPSPLGREQQPVETPPQTADRPRDFVPPDNSRPLTEAARDKQCLPAVMKLLAGGGTKARVVAARWLATMSSSSATSAPALADAANDADPTVREEALNALMALGFAAKPAAPRLAALLQASDARSDPLHLANVLMRIDPQADVIPQLVESLGDRQPERRILALQLLAELGRPRAASAAPAVGELLTDDDPRMRIEAIAVYSRLAEPREAIAVLRTALSNEKNRAVKRNLAQAIVRLQDTPP